jgi:hypothetical protein
VVSGTNSAVTVNSGAMLAGTSTVSAITMKRRRHFRAGRDRHPRHLTVAGKPGPIAAAC